MSSASGRVTSCLPCRWLASGLLLSLVLLLSDTATHVNAWITSGSAGMGRGLPSRTTTTTAATPYSRAIATGRLLFRSSVFITSDVSSEKRNLHHLSCRTSTTRAVSTSRRQWWQDQGRWMGATLLISSSSGMLGGAGPARAAAERLPLDELLYRILRVKEATQQEMRLIRSGKFKDVQRANIKLAVRFMLDNYRLSDAMVAASTYLTGPDDRASLAQRLEAAQVGQSAVQNLQTILEYFDAATVENLKVGSTSLSGKEDLVLRGLDATRQSLDDFLAYFPADTVSGVVRRIQQENALNVQEFDTALGRLINVVPNNP